MLDYAHAAAEIAQAIAYDDSHGYSQPNRAGDGTTSYYTLSDGTTATVHGGDYDCSSLVLEVYIAAGLIDPGEYMWTGNEDALLKAYGFERRAYSPYDLMIGDVLWKKGHTGIYVGDGLMVDAHGDEVGGITGPTPGDQYGWEIEERSVLACSWVYTYRYVGHDGRTAEQSSEGDRMTPTTFSFVFDTNIRDAPGGKIIATGDQAYKVGEAVTVDELAYADGIVWGGYTGSSGKRRYVAIGHTDRVEQI